MGFLIWALLWAVVLIVEIERTPDERWVADSFAKILLLRETRKSIAFIFALVVGGMFFAFELLITLHGRSTFNVIQAIGLAIVLLGCVLYAISKKG